MIAHIVGMSEKQITNTKFINHAAINIIVRMKMFCVIQSHADVTNQLVINL